MKTKDLTQENISKLTKLFPELLTEVEKDGELIKTIDIKKLKELVGDFADESDEVYELSWVGKQKSRQKIVKPINKTLRPIPDESVDFEETENLYIEGDNFEVLRLLQESYLNKIKIIYIDPPYNTGKDFIYKDKFSISKEDYDEETGAIDNEGNKLFRNTSTNGRFHSDWLSMMLERLIIARDLMTEDGVFFISIDDNEVFNLKKVCDEVFGENNFLSCISRVTGTPTGGGFKSIVNDIDYFLAYSKSSEISIEGLPLTENEMKIYDKTDEKGNYLIRPLRRTGGEDRKEDRPSMYYPLIAPDGTEVFPIAPAGYDSRWICGKKKYQELNDAGLIEWIKKSNGEVSQWHVYQKFYLEGRLKQPSNLWKDMDGNKKATRDLKLLFDGKKIFEFPKPVELIKKMIQLSPTKNDIVLDFFSGSGTTAHAVMQQNSEDGGNRKFIMIQLPEPIEEGSEAFKAGYKNISEIGKERIRRAAKIIKEESIGKIKQKRLGEENIESSNFDFGFRVFKLDSSNMKDVYYNPSEIDQRTLINYKDNIKEDRSDKDLLFQVLLELAIPISAKINEENVNNKTIYRVNEDFLIACFDEDIDLKIIKKIAEYNPLRIVFKDSSFKDDATKVNCDEYLKNKLPNTIVKVI